MSEDQPSSATEAAQRQVRVQLTSHQEDIALPDNTGPILVPTGKNLPQLLLQNRDGFKRLIFMAIRSATLRTVDTSEQSPGQREAGSVRVFDQWNISSHLHR